MHESFLLSGSVSRVWVKEPMTHFRSVLASSSLAASLVSALLLFPGTQWKHSETDLVA